MTRSACCAASAITRGPLAAVPFAALIAPGSAAGSRGEGSYLLASHEIVGLPSLEALGALRAGEQRASGSGDGRLVLFADPALPAGGPYRPLPGSRAEALRIRELAAPGRETFLALGPDASREAFLGRAWAPSGEEGEGGTILYFATHGVLHPRPELSGLVLASGAGGEGRPGFVTGLEIAGMDLPVALVVLSACETAVGPEVQGEGTLGLAWSFLHAGARRVISTLWQVEDERTAALMGRFFELLEGGGMPPARALRQAQLEALERPGAAPRDWAGFLFTGEFRDLPRSRRPQKGDSR